MSKSAILVRVCMRLVPAAITVLLLILQLVSPADAAPSTVPLPGITPTATFTPTAVPPPVPSPTPTKEPDEDTKPEPVITKRGEPTEALPGEEVIFTLEVTNKGQEAAVDVVVIDDIPVYLEILDVTTTQGTVTIEGQRVTVAVGVVGPGFVVEIVIRTRVREDTPAPVTMENVAVLKAPNYGQRISPAVIITVPGPLLPQSGGGSILWLVVVCLGSGLVALGVGLRKCSRA